MKIASFNINGTNARLPRLLEWLEETKPDVACLQEIKTVTEKFPTDVLEQAGYHCLVHGQKGFNGVAILSRSKAQLRRTGLPGAPDALDATVEEQARYIEAEVDGVVIASIYLPNGNPQPGPKFDYKLRWCAALRAHALQLLAQEKPVVLAGDYNICPEDRDVGDMKAMTQDALVQPESRAEWRQLCAQGWLDALRALHPQDAHLYTFWDYQAGCWSRNAGLRIDHLLLSPMAADRLKRADVDRATRGKDKASDHAPTWVELRAL